jgi:hypothetical protein
MPNRSFTAWRNRCLQPRYFSVVCTEKNVAQEKLNLFQLTSRIVTEPSARPSEVMGREF